MGTFSRMNPNPFEGRSAADLDLEVEKWGRIARDSAGRGDDTSADYARDARAAALAKVREQRP
jgi:hypothetical protein